MTGGRVFVVFEGIDGSGKSTQARRLTQALTKLGRRALSTAEPTDSAIGKLLRQYLAGEVLLAEDCALPLFLADREDHVFGPGYGILHHLQAGTDVICDRYLLSTLAYQAQEPRRAHLIEDFSERLPLPNITFLMRVTPEIALARKHSARERYETLGTLSQVAYRYERYAQQLAREHNVIAIDANRDADTCEAEILEHLQSLIERTSCKAPASPNSP